MFILSNATVSYASNQTIGLLRTEHETYPNEIGLSGHVLEMLEDNFGVKVKLLDYNKLVQCDNPENAVKSFIHQHHIKHVIIPGNNYNLTSPPFTPNSNRQDITAILSKMADNNEIYLMGICGGLQGIMYAKEVKILDIEGLNQSEHEHVISFPNPQAENVPLHRINISPNSYLGHILMDQFNNDDTSIYLPDAHHQVLSNSPDNISKMESYGYKIVGLSDDGIIEIIEDKFGNIHFQGHPEALIISDQKRKNISSLRNHSVQLVLSIFENFLCRR